MVPVEEEGDAFSYIDVDELLERARGKYECGSVKEGIVVRPVEPVYSKSLSASLSFKVINNDYLLKKQRRGRRSNIATWLQLAYLGSLLLGVATMVSCKGQRLN